MRHRLRGVCSRGSSSKVRSSPLACPLVPDLAQWQRVLLRGDGKKALPTYCPFLFAAALPLQAHVSGLSPAPPPPLKMRYVAAYLLAVLGGNESPTSKDLKKILDSVGIETDDERMNKVVISELNGKNIEDVIAQAEEKKEEKKEESEESDDDMGFGLFD
ncbi:Rplp2 [Columba livia]|nr:Rplp2 [Columba livia]